MQGARLYNLDQDEPQDHSSHENTSVLAPGRAPVQ
jgi:hypothetical protein